ncbi:uncharacterized protein CANTADRAFT_25336 [Suhomyces tanzawaensis NRRL Y-17324]|uniref:Uncharacterized protein n=1 Tax=Suhomyces tanzawaensis NRRL Y-17324 TaxID=984487 RepID=A0A1E4SNK6_9ASCO|nr:uncharacterized protein CANTADRAFT_25336 [Suhomyces tanzawaensis NRRL Y-17324]ODV81075.1 hypothetical protein CANTADRAFT_25336 [Suhomyces tanzawaensis NRRL Y-17324]
MPQQPVQFPAGTLGRCSAKIIGACRDWRAAIVTHNPTSCYNLVCPRTQPSKGEYHMGVVVVDSAPVDGSIIGTTTNPEVVSASWHIR